MINQPVPAVTLKTRVRDENVEGANPFRWLDIDTGAHFAEGRHILFGLPGAFTRCMGMLINKDHLGFGR